MELSSTDSNPHRQDGAHSPARACAQQASAAGLQPVTNADRWWLWNRCGRRNWHVRPCSWPLSEIATHQTSRRHLTLWRTT